MGVEYMDRACRATLNFFTETLRGTHPAPANIMDLLMVADGPPTARERCAWHVRDLRRPSEAYHVASMASPLTVCIHKKVPYQ